MALITPQQVIRYSPSDAHLDIKKIEPYIEISEYKWLQEFLGDAMYFQLLTEKAGAGFSTANQTLWDSYLAKYLSFCVIYQALATIQWGISTSGLMLNNSEYAMSDTKALPQVEKGLLDNINITQRQIADYLKRNAATYPLYKENQASGSCCDDDKPKQNTNPLGIFFGSDDNCGCDVEVLAPFTPPPPPTPLPKLQLFAADCPNEITLNGVVKNGDIVQPISQTFLTINDLHTYLLTLDNNFQLLGNKIAISSIDTWILLICCC